MATYPGILAVEPKRQRSLVGYSPWCCKESDITERLTYTLRIYLSDLMDPKHCISVHMAPKVGN